MATNAEEIGEIEEMSADKSSGGGTGGVGSKRQRPQKRKAAVTAGGGIADSASLDTPTMAPTTSAHDGTSDGREVLELPQIVSSLWEHQQRSVAATVGGVKAGKLGFADASTVGAGKTLTALATAVELAAHLEASGVQRHGVLVLLPEVSGA